MFTPRQIQCMEAIGLVPWVRRTAATVQATGVMQADVAAKRADVVSQPVAPVQATNNQATGQIVVCGGDTTSPLLLIFDTRDGESSWPLSKLDDILLDGMLRAIGLSKASVCSCAIMADASKQGQSMQVQPLPSLCHAPRIRFLYFGGEAILADETDPIPATQSAPDGVLDGWHLPTLAMLREEPQRKRQAWLTLKQLRSALDH